MTHGHVHSNFKAKTSFWGHLPWLLFGMAADDEETARGVARRCIAAFEDDAMSPESFPAAASPLPTATTQLPHSAVLIITDVGIDCENAGPSDDVVS